MKALRDRLQHRLNPLHVYCRLRSAGVRTTWARRLSSLYEKHFYRALAL